MKNIPSTLIAELQQICEMKLERTITLSEAEDVGRRLLETFSLMFNVEEKRMSKDFLHVTLTVPKTNETM
jgi:hypothetical protein